MTSRMKLPLTARTRAELFEALASFAAAFYGRPITFYVDYRGREIEAKATAADIERDYRAMLAEIGTTPEEDEAVRTVEDFRGGEEF